MDYRVLMIESDEGFAVNCPSLRGCHSQGRTRAEAIENIRDYALAGPDRISVGALTHSAASLDATLDVWPL